MNITLTSQQEAAAGLAIVKLTEKRENCKIGGYAGTGKTTLISSVLSRLEQNFKKVCVMAPTGKAANVLCNKDVPARTIHSTLYECENSEHLEFTLRDSVDCDYFIVDESSMLDEDLLADILSFRKPTLFIGDPAQLESIGKDARVMHAPDYTLTQIHRTAEDSEIIKFATALRTSAIHPVAYYNTLAKADNMHPSLTFKQLSDLRRSDWMAFDQVIVGKNITRHKFNQTFKKSHDLLPVEYDKIICLRNDYTHGVFNGELFTCTSSEYTQCETTGELTLELENSSGFTARYPFWREYFFDQTIAPYNKPRNCCWFDFAYAITCHKSQGSEWDNVAVVDEAFGTPPNRWRYTAATRAAKKLTWIR